MSPRDPTFEDPFGDDDAEARERARRRAERESKRRERDNRASLASRVSGAMEGAASKGREAIEQQREKARSPEPPAEGVEPPSFRRPAPRQADPAPSSQAPPGRPASRLSPPPDSPERRREPASAEPVARAEAQTPASPRDDDTFFQRPGDSERRLSSEEAMPRRESMFTPRPVDTGEADAVAPEPVTVVRAPGESEEWTAPPTAAGGGGGPRRPRRTTHTAGSGWTLWRRRLLALGAIALLVVGAVFAFSKVSGGDPEPTNVSNEKPVKTVNVTIPEGLTAEEIAKVAKKAGLKGDYMKAEKEAAKSFDVEKLGGPKDASLEGFLFPATYEVEQGANVKDLIEKQLTEGFEANFAQVDMKAAEKANLTEFDVVTIASMIEREVQVPEERPIVSSVIQNRLRDGMTLGIDATVRYALDNNFTDSLTTTDLQVDSCYNTYVNPGLPCGPISNPGLDSLQAAANPDDTKFLYYVVKPGTCPAAHTFTETEAEFQAASAEYDAAQAEAGGSPTC